MTKLFNRTTPSTANSPTDTGQGGSTAKAAVSTISPEKRKLILIGVAISVALAAAMAFKAIVLSSEKVQSAQIAADQAQNEAQQAELRNLGQAPGTGSSAQNFPIAAPSTPEYTVETPDDKYTSSIAAALRADMSEFGKPWPADERECFHLNPKQLNQFTQMGYDESVCKSVGAAKYFQCAIDGHRWDVMVPGCELPN